MENKEESSDDNVMDYDDQEMDEDDDEPEDLELAEDEVEVPADDSGIVLSAHTNDVFTLAISKRFNCLLSGSQDDTAILWALEGKSAQAPPTSCVIGRHDDSVVQVNFSHDETLLASAAMNGKLHIHETTSKALLYEIDECEDVEWILWHPSCNILFAGDSTGVFFMFLLSKKQVERSKVYVAEGKSACTTGRLMPDSKSLICGYESGVVSIWKLADSSHIDVDTQTPCRSLDIHPTLPLAAVGSHNGTVHLINTSNANVLWKVESAKADGDENADKSGGAVEDDGDERSVETVKFASPQFAWLAAGTANGIVTLYDIETGKARHKCSHDGAAVVKVEWLLTNAGGVRIVTACVDGALRGWDAKTGEPVFFKSGGGQSIYDLLVVPNEDSRAPTLYTANAGGIIRIYEYAEELDKTK